jgi:phosphatidylserine/phosphatidylglycerophosphate/cardiolipin synthase-like enzyme
MTKKASKPSAGKTSASSSKKSSGGGSQSLLGTILGLIVVVAGVIFSALTGVNPFESTGTAVPRTAVPATSVPATAAGGSSGGTGRVELVTLPMGFGAKKGFWEVYFTAPTENRDRKTYVNGIDVPLATAIDNVKNTLDIAAFEWNNPVITEAVLRAAERGVRVRMVVDNEYTVEEDDSTIAEMELADIPIVEDGRSALMHNKIMIMDGITVWIGAMNFTVNGVYRNYNNLVMLRSRRAVEIYQAEFDEMFTGKQFGPRSPKTNTGSFTQDNTPIEVYFASENDVIGPIIREINAAKQSIRFMAFSFTRDDMAQAMLARSRAGVNVQGVFERTGSATQFSELTPLFCAGLDVRQDGYSGVMHHKVVVIDGSVVITGSFNFSDNAVESNDENLVIIRDKDLATQFLAEFDRVQKISVAPTGIVCN